MKSLVLVLFLTSLVLSGCSSSSEKDSISKSDLCIIHIDSGKEVCYGMNRSEAEKVLGNGKQSVPGYEYDFGVKILYRKDTIAGIQLIDDSKGVFKTAGGAEVGMSKSEIKKLYGDKYALELAEHNLDYYYDSSNKTFLGKVSIDQKRTPEESKSIYLISIVTDFNEGNTSGIFISDLWMARTFS